ncbi:DEHA2B12320p [Debaryomyces hansenii CBS767]|uniref:DEHA2B12320p n=1 Tax=Debaryomyces hansenii (strain ATCC 36239 / CBS 767 / BCRC 21394 / JCM 1990 / NBRC 0083 / IGC 2968) TaxID=284592 RepID=Q6BWC9_DEBHA|nr:DEHA2B12320p [Debaryomyces hansenii CBS767]CAG85494.1 DEHA2B12320p [Debaryomyces hansenii CBS767]|eukprot:XP_457490.1 DEHA2B12320p [Debaryomyces hansenii CBS767]
MGNKASKPSRKLANTISKNANPNINRSSNVNQLPSEFLKEKYEQNAIQKELKAQQEKSTPDESLNQGDQMHILNSNNEFDPKLLNKKLKNSQQAKSQVPAQQQNQTPQMPEGKDGFDPHVGSYDQNFINSVTNLGKNIHSSRSASQINPNFSALTQLRNRKALYEKGQKEVETQMDPHGPASASHRGENKDVIRTMIHPRTMGAILNDLRDPRVSKDGITLDYQLRPGFLEDLGSRFKVATTTQSLEEHTKDDEIAPKEAPNKSMMDFNENDELAETVDQNRLNELKGRLGMDDEPENIDTNKR